MPIDLPNIAVRQLYNLRVGGAEYAHASAPDE